MEAVLDFLRAAMPWITMGLLLAIFAARQTNKKKDKTDDYGTEGMCLGMCLGTAISTDIGLCMGMLMGLLIGSCIKKEKKDNVETEKKPGSSQ